MSSDILTQLKTCYDQLLTQFFSTISYLSQRHPLVPPHADPSDPFTNPPQPTTTTNASHTPVATSATNTDQAAAGLIPGPEDVDRAPYPLRPVSTQTFENAQNELAEDLVLKGQQIELLISRLPGIGRGEEEQAGEIQMLVERVREMEKRRKEKRREMKRYVKRLESVVMGMAESIDYGDVNGDHGANGHG